jgi:hypothetical protein
VHLAAQALCRHGRLNSNVRPHQQRRAFQRAMPSCSGSFSQSHAGASRLRAFAPSRICQALAAIRKEAAATLRHTVCPWPSAGRPPRREHKPQIHATACSPASRRRQFASRGAQGSRSSACGPRPLLPLAPGFIILGASPRARLRPKRYAVASGCTLPAPPGEA